MDEQFVDWIELHVICATVPAETGTTKPRSLNTTHQSKPLRSCYTETGIVDFYKSGNETATVEEIKEYNESNIVRELPSTSTCSNQLFNSTPTSTPIPIPVSQVSTTEFTLPKPKLKYGEADNDFVTAGELFREQQSIQEENRERGKFSDCQESFQGQFFRTSARCIDESKKTSTKKKCTCEEYNKDGRTHQYVCSYCCERICATYSSGSESVGGSIDDDFEMESPKKNLSERATERRSDRYARSCPSTVQASGGLDCIGGVEEKEDLLPKTCHQPDNLFTPESGKIQPRGIWSTNYSTEEEAWGNLYHCSSTENGPSPVTSEVCGGSSSNKEGTSSSQSYGGIQETLNEEKDGDGDYILYSPFEESGSDGLTLPISQNNGPYIRNQTYPDTEWPPRLFTDDERTIRECDNKVGVGLCGKSNGFDFERIREGYEICKINEGKTTEKLQKRSFGDSGTRIQSEEKKDINQNGENSANIDRLHFLSEDSLTYLQLSSCYRTTCFACNKTWFPPCDGCYQRDRDQIQALQNSWSELSRGAYQTWSDNRLRDSVRAYQSSTSPQSPLDNTNQGENLPKRDYRRSSDQIYTRLVDHIIGQKDLQAQRNDDQISPSTNCGSNFDSGRSDAANQKSNVESTQTNENRGVCEGNGNEKQEDPRISAPKMDDGESRQESSITTGVWNGGTTRDPSRNSYCGFQKGFLQQSNISRPENISDSTRSIQQPESYQSTKDRTETRVPPPSNTLCSEGSGDRAIVLGKSKIRNSETEETGKRIRQFYEELTKRNQASLQSGSKPYVTRIVKAIEKFPIPDKPGVYGERTTYFDNDGEFIDFIVGKIYIHMYIYET